MNETYQIKKSYTSTKVKTIIVALIAALLFLTTSRIVGIIDDLFQADTQSLALLVRAVAFSVGLLSVVLTWVRDTKSSYSIEGGRLVIQRGSLTGKSKQEIITPPQAPKVRVLRSLLASRFNYGTIALDVDYFSHRTTYELKDVADPEKVVAELTARLHTQ